MWKFYQIVHTKDLDASLELSQCGPGEISDGYADHEELARRIGSGDWPKEWLGFGGFGGNGDANGEGCDEDLNNANTSSSSKSTVASENSSGKGKLRMKEILMIIDQ
jgi:hypothetical protein